MVATEIMSIALKINNVFPNSINGKDGMKVWMSTFAPYSFEDVDSAVDKYIHSKPFPPKPADIIRLLPERKKTFISNGYRQSNLEEFTTEDGTVKRYRTFKCLDCEDRGLLTWRDENDCLMGKPCHCELGKVMYPKAYQEYYERVIS